MFSRHFTSEEKFGLIIALLFHIMVVIGAVLWSSNPEPQRQRAFIEVTMGEFSDGTMADFSREEAEEVATTPEEPVETEPEEPVEEPQEQVEQEQVVEEEPTRDVELPEEQEEVVSDEVVETPETEEVDPEEFAEDIVEDQEEIQLEEPREEAEEEQEGEEESGDIRGIRGDPEADQGPGAELDRSSPYQLEWEGDIERTPVVQPLPDYNVNVEAVIRVRFEVKPDGTVGRLVPLIRMNPELEREVFRTMRSWRFSRLPSGVPQESQWGTITFRFVLD